MTIKEMEEHTGLSRSHIRFYEKEGLLSPRRNETNGYREYSEEDVKNIQKIACLRTLGISVEEIRQLADGKANLRESLRRQEDRLTKQLSEISQARMLCREILSEPQADYENLDVERYVADLDGYWEENETALARDLAGFWHVWGSMRVWGCLTTLSLLFAAFGLCRLPERIPIQWQGGAVSATADRRFIFAYPAACVLLRFWLKPFIERWLATHTMLPNRRAIAEGIVNFLCAAAWLIELITILSAG